MRTIILVLLLQALAAPDPAQMEKAPELGYMPIAQTLHLPDGFKLGAPAGVATNREGRLLVFNRGDHPLIEVDKAGTFVRSLGEGQYVRPHGLRVDAAGNIWTTDVNGHTVTKMSPEGQVLLVFGVKGQPGEWTEAADRHFLNEPNDIAIDAAGNIFVVQGHGNADPRVLKFDKSGTFIRTWGSKERIRRPDSEVGRERPRRRRHWSGRQGAGRIRRGPLHDVRTCRRDLRRGPRKCDAP